MAITAKDVSKAAHLARTELSPEETESFRQDLDRILEYMDQLREVEIDRLQTQTRPTSESTPLRPDQVKPSLSRKDALANA